MPEFDRRKPSLLNLLGLRQLAHIYSCYSAIFHFSSVVRYALCPMPTEAYALCPMPYARRNMLLRKAIYHVSQQGDNHLREH